MIRTTNIGSVTEALISARNQDRKESSLSIYYSILRIQSTSPEHFGLSDQGRSSLVSYISLSLFHPISSLCQISICSRTIFSSLDPTLSLHPPTPISACIHSTPRDHSFFLARIQNRCCRIHTCTDHYPYCRFQHSHTTFNDTMARLDSKLVIYTLFTAIVYIWKLPLGLIIATRRLSPTRQHSILLRDH